MSQIQEFAKEEISKSWKGWTYNERLKFLTWQELPISEAPKDFDELGEKTQESLMEDWLEVSFKPSREVICLDE